MTKIINVRLFEARTASDYVRITKVLKQWNGQNDLETLRNLCSFAEDKKGVDVQTIIEQFTDSIAPAMEQPFFHKKALKPLQVETLPTIESSTPVREESLRERLFKAVQERKGWDKLTIEHLQQLNKAFRDVDQLGTDEFEQQVTYLTFNCI
jgi:hypothetical protein